MMKKNISRGRLIFVCVWLGIFAVSYIVWAFYLSAVSNRLAEYERSHPENAAKKVFADYFLNADPNDFSSYDDAEQKFDADGSAKEYYYNLTYGKALAFTEQGKTDGLVTYSVTANGSEFARFVLSEDESGGWKLAKIVLTARPSNELYIQAPKASVVTVNGVLLDGEYAVSEYMLADSPIFGGNAEGRVMVTYLIKGLYCEPVLSVKLTEGGVSLGLDKESESDFSAEKSYLSYLSYLYYGKN